MYVYPSVCPCVTLLFVPRGTKISHPQVGGDKQIVCPRGTNIFHIQGGDKHFPYEDDAAGNVSGANILSSEARKPPAGARIQGP